MVPHKLNTVMTPSSDNNVPAYSAQSGSSKQSVLTHCLSGGGEVMVSAVVHMGKQGSGDQSVLTRGQARKYIKHV